MSEANTPKQDRNYWHLHENHNVIDVSITDNTNQNVSTDIQTDLEDTANATTIEQTIELEGRSMISDPPDIESLATTNNSIISADKEAEWLALSQKLRHHNWNLLNRVGELEKDLGESQEALHLYQGRSQSQETLLTQQIEELNAASEQISRLFCELEASHSVAKRQQILIETLTEQLATAQERIADLETEGNEANKRYIEQSHRLKQTENTARELRDRLQRQQRHTLQLKAALEKCLEVPRINYEAKTEALNSAAAAWSQRHLKNILAAQSILQKAQPIQPWSSSELDNENQNHAIEMFSIPNQELAEILDEETDLEQSDRHSELSDDSSPEIEEDYQSDYEWESVEELPNSIEPLAGIYDEAEYEEDEQSINPINTNEPESDISWVSDLFDLLDEDVPSQTTDDDDADDSVSEPAINHRQVVSPLYSSQASTGQKKSIDLPIPSNYVAPSVQSNYVAPQVASSDRIEHNNVDDDVNYSYPQSTPSPVLYPRRPATGRKSLAAVQLPSFPRNNR